MLFVGCGHTLWTDWCIGKLPCLCMIGCYLCSTVSYPFGWTILLFGKFPSGFSSLFVFYCWVLHAIGYIWLRDTCTSHGTSLIFLATITRRMDFVAFPWCTSRFSVPLFGSRQRIVSRFGFDRFPVWFGWHIGIHCFIAISWISRGTLLAVCCSWPVEQPSHFVLVFLSRLSAAVVTVTKWLCLIVGYVWKYVVILAGIHLCLVSVLLMSCLLFVFIAGCVISAAFGWLGFPRVFCQARDMLSISICCLWLSQSHRHQRAYWFLGARRYVIDCLIVVCLYDEWWNNVSLSSWFLFCLNHANFTSFFTSVFLMPWWENTKNITI